MNVSSVLPLALGASGVFLLADAPSPGPGIVVVVVAGGIWLFDRLSQVAEHRHLHPPVEATTDLEPAQALALVEAINDVEPLILVVEPPAATVINKMSTRQMIGWCGACVVSSIIGTYMTMPRTLVPTTSDIGLLLILWAIMALPYLFGWIQSAPSDVPQGS